MLRILASLLLALLPAGTTAQTPVPSAAAPAEDWLRGDVSPVHDPVLIRAGKTWHVFSTGLGEGPHGLIGHRTSSDRTSWVKQPPRSTSCRNGQPRRSPAPPTCGRRISLS